MDAIPRKSPLERFLTIFTEVRTGEAPTALMLTLNVFLLLSAYYIIKPVREALIIAGEGAEVKSYAAAGMALLLLLIVPGYAKLASRLPRRPLINTVTFIFMGCLVVFYVWAHTAPARTLFTLPLGFVKIPFSLGLVFFLWVGIFNIMVVAQFWSFANDIYTEEAGKRLFVIVAFGASAGAVLGSKIAGLLIAPLGIPQLLLVSAAVLGLALVLTNLVDRRERARRIPRVVTPDAAPAKPTVDVDAPVGRSGAFALLYRNRYLLLIAFMILFLNWVNTTGEYILGRTVQNAATEAVKNGTAGGLTEEEFIGEFYSNFFSVVNVVGLLMQLFVVSRILKFLGVKFAILILPLIALSGYTLLAFAPVLAFVRWAKTAENATDYSLQNTLRGVLFLPTNREEKYKAKQAIDTFCVRMGDVLSGVLVYVGTVQLSLPVQGFATVNLALVAVWLGLSLVIGRRYRQLAAVGAAAARQAA